MGCLDEPTGLQLARPHLRRREGRLLRDRRRPPAEPLRGSDARRARCGGCGRMSGIRRPRKRSRLTAPSASRPVVTCRATAGSRASSPSALNSLRGLREGLSNRSRRSSRKVALALSRCPPRSSSRRNVWVWLALVASVLFVLVVEFLNTAVERLCNHVTPERHEAIRVTKDLASDRGVLRALPRRAGLARIGDRSLRLLGCDRSLGCSAASRLIAAPLAAVATSARHERQPSRTLSPSPSASSIR